MTTLLERLHGVEPYVAYLVVSGFVFLEDALLIGFVVPGEAAAIAGGVIASQSNAALWVMIAVVVCAAVLGDTVGYGIGRSIGPRVHRIPMVSGKRLDDAAAFLRRRGGPAVFLGRFVAFVRTAMPALAGMTGMPYRRFLGFNVGAATLFGAGSVLLGYTVGSSYATVESVLGGGLWVVLGVLLAGAVAWRARRRIHARRERRPHDESAARLPWGSAPPEPELPG
ncbi:DedA family protein [Rhodococcus gannanensis]|uniref:DedA family protein n=1 Tax=Rhodococcus gannanensis TaxID=1960308 RepID=A0ABW4P9U0_9NOCA